MRFIINKSNEKAHTISMFQQKWPSIVNSYRFHIPCVFVNLSKELNKLI